MPSETMVFWVAGPRFLAKDKLLTHKTGDCGRLSFQAPAHILVAYSSSLSLFRVTRLLYSQAKPPTQDPMSEMSSSWEDRVGFAD